MIIRDHMLIRATRVVTIKKTGLVLGLALVSYFVDLVHKESKIMINIFVFI